MVQKDPSLVTEEYGIGPSKRSVVPLPMYMEPVGVKEEASSTYNLFEPANGAGFPAYNLLETLEKEVFNFETEVDAVLSEINATTFIEI